MDLPDCCGGYSTWFSAEHGFCCKNEELVDLHINEATDKWATLCGIALTLTHVLMIQVSFQVKKQKPHITNPHKNNPQMKKNSSNKNKKGKRRQGSHWFLEMRLHVCLQFLNGRKG